jgi:hypothetical protein
MTNTNHIQIDATNVVGVLLADGWHDVNPGTFAVATLRSGEELGRRGYCFEEANHGSPYGAVTLAGPLDAVMAVRQVTRRALRKRVPEPTWARTRSVNRAIHPHAVGT